MNALNKLLERMKQQSVWEGRLTLKRNEMLIREGKIDQRLFMVESGSILVFMTDGYDEHSVRFGYPGSLIAALDSFITAGPTELNLRALKKSELLYVSKPAYLSFIQSDQATTAIWNEVLTGLVHQQMEREQDLLTASPRERYLRVLRRSPQVFQEIPHKYIASYLRMTPETLSRIKSLDLDQGE